MRTKDTLKPTFELADITYIQASSGGDALLEVRTPSQDSLPHQYAIGEGTGAGFVLYPAQKLVVITLGSRVTIQLLEEYARLLQADLSFEPTFSEIADMRAIAEVALGSDEMLRMADEIDPFSNDSKRAFVVRTSTQAHAARLHKILLTHRHFEIFRSLEEARRWIDT